MGYHSFSLDPRTILGVGPSATLDDIRNAFRAKSKKHHPDHGGDEWAFRMVARAYEVLRTTAGSPSPTPWRGHDSGVMQTGKNLDWGSIWSPSAATASAAPRSSSGANQSDEEPSYSATRSADNVEDEDAESATEESASFSPLPDKLRTVDVELIWTRFEKDGSSQLLATQEGDDATLSVCMVISWPPHQVINQASQFRDAGETLRSLIEVFATVRDQRTVIAARSRIEDGRFVGWLSFVDVLTAQDAFLVLRQALQARDLTVKLYTRDERVPFDWYGANHQPVMSQVS
jgi:hypothetical protein